MVIEGPLPTDPHLLLDAIERFVPSATRRKAYRAYILRLSEKNLPIIFDSAHLAQITGIEHSVLRSMAFGTSSFYQSFKIPKKSGGSRQIDAPLPSLLEVQRFILKEILEKQEISAYSTAYRKNKTIIDHVTPHSNSKSLLRVDLKDFFPSIKLERIRRVFIELGYTPRVSTLLSHLVTLEGSLPQGAPTSPCLSNIIILTFDEGVGKVCTKEGFIYTRYADDLAFSAPSEIPHSFLTALNAAIEEHGFKINERKTKFFGKRHGTWLLTGLSIGRDGRVRLPKAKRRSIRQRAHYLISYLSKDLDNKSEVANHLLSDVLLPDRVIGQLGFWLWVEPSDKSALQMLERLRTALLEVTSDAAPISTLLTDLTQIPRIDGVQSTIDAPETNQQ